MQIMSRWRQYTTGKTLKREVAVLFLGVTCYFGVTGDAVMAEIFIAPATLFAMAAFGLDAAAKQLQFNRRVVDAGVNIDNVETHVHVDPTSGRAEP
jgi:hypothetical protein